MTDNVLLKEELKRIKKNKFEIPTEKRYQLTVEMIEQIGNIDPELRDDLIYVILWNWIVSNKYSEEQLREILKSILDDSHLFYRIGEKDNDTIFTRAFSALIIPPILAVHQKNPFLSHKEVEEILKKVIKFVMEEKDYRGYVIGKGWAHAIAHGANALDELAKCAYLQQNELMSILDVVKVLIQTTGYVYINEEDERLVTAVLHLLKRDLIDSKEIVEWIENFGELHYSGELPQDDNLHINVKNFLRSLYFRLLAENHANNYLEIIRKILDKISRFKD